MSDQKGLDVAGARQTQPAEAIARANQIKAMEERFYRLIDELAAANVAVDPKMIARYDARDIAIARTHIQEGCSALVRSIFMPKRLTDEELAKIEGPANKTAVDG